MAGIKGLLEIASLEFDTRGGDIELHVRHRGNPRCAHGQRFAIVEGVTGGRQAGHSGLTSGDARARERNAQG